MKKLIADSGSTKTDWVKISGDSHSPYKSETYTGLGLNPHLLKPYEIEAEMIKVCMSLGREYDEIRFFGAGVGNQEMARIIEECIENVFYCPDIKADSDIAGACKALLGNKPGIVCIMGTGSNSCHYDGTSIDHKSTSLGYILDDNGGGVAFGRRLLSDVFKGIAPPEISEEFTSRYNLSASEVVDNIYRKPSPNRWIAGFMPFIIEHKCNPYISNLIDSQLNNFFDREFCSYSEHELKTEGIGFVGSVSYFLSAEIETQLALRGWKIRNILRKPLEKLL